ncbi:MAG TPA: hypothetical protein VFM74_05030 [Candidatus Limnocylindria bacterium]|nr:hypothetical protein [Candidatus Limnocylindria bacterium]
MSPRPLEPHTSAGWPGGLRLDLPVDRVPPDSLIQSANARPGFTHALEKVGGVRRLVDDALGLINAAAVWFPHGSSGNAAELVLVTAAGHLYTAPWNPTGALTLTDQGAISVPGWGFPAQPIVEFRSGNTEVLVLFEASGDTVATWDGATLTTGITAPANFGFGAVYHDRLYAILGPAFGGLPVAKSTLYGSKVGDPTKWAAADGGFSAVVGTYDGQGLTQIATLAGSLLLFKTTSILRFSGSGPDDIAISDKSEALSDQFGCAVPNSLCRTPKGLFCWSLDGPILVSPGGVRLVGEAIRPLWRALPSGALELLIAGYQPQRRHVWCGLPTGTGQHRWYVWAVDTEQWYGPMYAQNGWSGCVSALTEDSNHRPESSRLLRVASVIDVLDDPTLTTLDEVGTGYTLTVETGALWPDAGAAIRSVEEVRLLGDIDAAAAPSLAATSEQGTRSVAVDTTQGWQRLRPRMRGRQITLTLTDATAKPVGLDAIDVLGRLERAG